MKLICDFHIHSKYSRATSRDMDISGISAWAKIKGIKIVGTSDFTHPLWLTELQKFLNQYSDGIYEYNGIYFILTAEVSNIYNKNGRIRKIHNVIFAPNFQIVEKINRSLQNYGDLHSDGRPIISISSEELVEIVLGISERSLIVPAHAWTPHFSLYGSNSGFDSIEECYGEYTSKIKLVETGLSSDPPMNWRLSELLNVNLISNSDAHSPKNLGREANVIECDKIDYDTVIETITSKPDKTKNNNFLYTIEFFPEEGKYHYDGHRLCKVSFSPSQSAAFGNKCPECGRPLTIGVLNRVEQLADLPEGKFPENYVDYKYLIPLNEIIADALNTNKNSVAVQNEYDNIIKKLGPELEILIDVPEEVLMKNMNPKIAENIIKMRNNEVERIPGYDGVYGIIKIKQIQEPTAVATTQLSLF